MTHGADDVLGVFLEVRYTGDHAESRLSFAPSWVDREDDRTIGFTTASDEERAVLDQLRDAMSNAFRVMRGVPATLNDAAREVAA